MGRAVNFDAVPDSNVVPEGLYQTQIESFEEKSSKSGKLMYLLTFEIMEPAEYAGQKLFEYFVIGSDEDPDGAEEATWNKAVGAQRMKQVLKKSQVPMDTDMDNIAAAAVQSQQVINVIQQVDEEGEYKGTIRNRIRGFYGLGEKEVGVTAAEAPKPKAPLASVPKAAAPAAAKPAPKAAAPAAAKPAAPRPNLPPGTQTPPRPAAAAPAAKPKSAEVKCSICETMVPRAEFSAHVEAHAEEA